MTIICNLAQNPSLIKFILNYTIIVYQLVAKINNFIWYKNFTGLLLFQTTHLFRLISSSNIYLITLL